MPIRFHRLPLTCRHGGLVQELVLHGIHDSGTLTRGEGLDVITRLGNERRNVQTALMDVADEDEARGLADLRRAFAHSACSPALSGRDSSATKLPTSLAVAASCCTDRIFWCFATTLFGRPTRNGTPRHGAAL
jgi:hypothetical protein